MKNPKIMVGNRAFVGNLDGVSKEIEKLQKFGENVMALPSVAACYTAVNMELDKANLSNLTCWHPEHKMLGIKAPGKFVPFLNALIDQAAMIAADYLLLLSTEIKLTEADLQKMLDKMDENTLMVGARLDGHEFHASSTVGITGVTTPWFTCCLVNVKKIIRLGIPMTGEALFDPTRKSAGVEEVATISLYQRLYADCDAKLIQLDSVAWETGVFEGERLERHHIKMASKKARPRAQVEFANLLSGVVQHIA